MESTNPKPFVFVLMPFSEQFTDVYEVGIKAACREAGAYCERLDEQIFVENMLERVYNQIAKADIIVADMTGKNPNVFYEVGYAHALNKRVILLTQNADDIPFDLKHYPHIVYGGKIVTLKPDLESRVKWCIENPVQPLESADINLEFTINGYHLDDNPNINVKPTLFDDLHIKLNISVLNSTKSIVKPSSFRLVVITDPNFTLSAMASKDIESGIILPDRRNLYNLIVQRTMFPGDWYSIPASVYNEWEEFPVHFPDNILRLLTAVGPKDHTFSVTIEEGKSNSRRRVS